MAKSENIFVRAKAYQKMHPRTAWAECIQKVKGKKSVSGAVKSKSVSGTRKKRTRISTHPVISSRSVSTRAVLTRIAKGRALLNEIDKLEAKCKEIKNRDLKDLYYIEINSLHRKLKNLKKSA